MGTDRWYLCDKEWLLKRRLPRPCPSIMKPAFTRLPWKYFEKQEERGKDPNYFSQPCSSAHSPAWKLLSSRLTGVGGTAAWAGHVGLSDAVHLYYTGAHFLMEQLLPLGNCAMSVSSWMLIAHVLPSPCIQREANGSSYLPSALYQSMCLCCW